MKRYYVALGALFALSFAPLNAVNLSLDLVFDQAPTAAGVTGTFTVSGTFGYGTLGQDLDTGNAEVGSSSYRGSISFPTITGVHNMTMTAQGPITGDFTSYDVGNDIEGPSGSILSPSIMFVGFPFSQAEYPYFSIDLHFQTPDYDALDNAMFSDNASLQFTVNISGAFVITTWQNPDAFDYMPYLNDTFTTTMFEVEDTYTVTASVVPEPSYYAMMAGLLGLCVAALKRRHR